MFFWQNKEFARELGNRRYKQHSRDELEASFKFFDKDDSGYIDADELYAAMKKFNPKITKESIKRLIAKVDNDNSGKISIDGKNFNNQSNICFK
jgi:Ca2+-binding EF-hand superfamily protein